MNPHRRILYIGIFCLVLFLTITCALPTQQVIVVTATEESVDALVEGGEEVEPTAVPQLMEATSPPKSTSEPTNTTQPRPTVTQANQSFATAQSPQISGSTVDAVWVGSFGYGLNLIDSAGWHTYLPDTSGLSGDQIKDIAVCETQAWVVSGLGVDSTDGTVWQSYKDDLGYASVEAVACDGKGGVWLAHYQGAHHYDGSAWTEYKSDLLGTGDYVDMVKDVAVAPDGSAWFITTNSVAKFDGSTWTVYETGSGFAKDYYFTAIVVDLQGNVWVGHGSGVWKFDGANWSNFESGNLSQVGCLAIDQNGYLWAGTYAKGLSMYNGQGWVNYNRQNSGLSSNNVRDIAVDRQNRIWIGTEWGMDVFDGQNWQTYNMHNSDLTDNDVYSIAAGGQGPPLPEWLDKGTGSLKGTLVRGEEPVVDARIEACTEFIGMFFSGDTPCADNPLRQETKTGADGSFVFAELPVGRYSIAFQTPDGWMYLTGSFGIGNQDILVKAGEETNLNVIDVSEDD